MPVSKQFKRKQADIDVYDNCSDFEDELKNRNSIKKSKKKKLMSESESEHDSSVSEIVESESSSESSDEDEPINKVLEKSSKTKNPKNMNVLSDSSDDDSLATKTSSNCCEPKDNSSVKSESEENELESSDDDALISKMARKSKQNGKSEKIVSSDSSDDEILASKTSLNHSKEAGSSKSSKTEPVENEFEFSGDDDDEGIGKIVKKSKQNGKAQKVKTSSASTSDDEPLTAKNTSFHSETKKKNLQQVSEPEEKGFESSGNEDDEPIGKIVKKSEQNEKTKKVKTSSASSSDDEPLTLHKLQNSPYHSEIKKKSKQASEPEEKGFESSDDDDEPFGKIGKKSKQNGKTEKNKHLDSDSDETLATKKAVKHKSKKQKSGHASSNEDEPSNKLQKSSNAKDRKAKSSSNDRIEHLKKYLRLSGIHIQSYDKLFADCKSMKSKSEKLLSILHEKGMKGRPTIEKCKKLRKKIETKKEISELDMSNIIQTEGRSKRGSGSSSQKVSKVENSPVEKRFSRLKDIIDSEDSD